MNDAHHYAHVTVPEFNMAKVYKQSVPKPTTIAESRMAHGTGKQRLNLTVRGDLLQRAKDIGLNLSQVMEQGLTQQLRQTEAAHWQQENAVAIAAYNARVERDGPLCADLVSL